MHRCADFAVGFRNELSFLDAISDENNWLRGRTHVLLDRQYEPRRNRSILDQFCGCLALVCGKAQASMQLAQVVGRRCHDNGLIVMQSTGQGATHSSQPVHSLSMTVCMNCGAPMLASTGQALRQ